MAGIKRKSVENGVVVREKKHSAPKNAPSSKKRKIGDEAPLPPPPAAQQKTPKPKNFESSLLQEEEPAFPRGGASVLTPLEYKQIQVQATRDVLFEESGARATGPPSDSDDEEPANATNEKGASNASKVKKTAKSKNKQRVPKDATSNGLTTRIRADGLKYKTLTPGFMVLGQISQIADDEMLLDLPNNLTGVVPIVSVSSKLNSVLAAVAAEDEDVDLISLTKKGFFLGQWLRASVLSTTEDLTGGARKSKKKIELSIQPQDANKDITVSDMAIHTTVQASVDSIEDHGFIMDIGIGNDAVKGFLSADNIPRGVTQADIAEGSVYLCRVTGVSSKGKVIELSADHRQTLHKKLNVLSNPSSINVLRPGTLVEALVSDVSETGINGQIAGSIKISAGIVHSGAGPWEIKLSEKFKVGMKVRGRIIFTPAELQTGVVGISLLEHLVYPKPESRKAEMKIGAIINEAKIVTIETGLGLYLDLEDNNSRAFVHMSKIADKRIEDISSDSGTFQLGSKHQARIIGYNSLDHLYLASLEKSVLEQQYLRIEDVEVGSIVKGHIDQLVINATGFVGLAVNIAKGISGLVPEIHVSDVKLQHPERKYKEGMKVTARILSTDLTKRQIRLTLKKSLVNADVAIWKDYKDISVGSQSVGTIVKVNAKGAVLQFFGNVRAFCQFLK